MMKFRNKKFKAAIKIEESLWESEKNGNKIIHKAEKPKLWYTGRIDDENFKVNIIKTHVPLNASDKKKYLAYIAKKGNDIEAGEPTVPKDEIVDREEPADDLPF
jgi:hypothetical protein